MFKVRRDKKIIKLNKMEIEYIQSLLSDRKADLSLTSEEQEINKEYQLNLGLRIKFQDLIWPE